MERTVIDLTNESDNEDEDLKVLQVLYKQQQHEHLQASPIHPTLPPIVHNSNQAIDLTNNDDGGEFKILMAVGQKILLGIHVAKMYSYANMPFDIVGRISGVYLKNDSSQISRHNHMFVLNTNHRVIGYVDHSSAQILSRLLSDKMTMRYLQLHSMLDTRNNGVLGPNSFKLLLAFYADIANQETMMRILYTYGIDLIPIEQYEQGGSESYQQEINWKMVQTQRINSEDYVKGIFNNIRDGRDLSETEPHSDVKTKLFPHQKMALTFLTEREKETKSDDETMWKFQKSSGLYENIFTQQLVPQRPREPQGGILADDMGLGKSLTILSLIMHDLHDSAGTTLILCPPSVLSNWQEQIEAHLNPGSLNAYLFHGTTRRADKDFLLKYDVVLTTYGTLAAEFKKSSKRKLDQDDEYGESTSCLHQIEWHRIILDESHIIKDTKTLQAKAVHELHGDRRWCLSGTPLQNNLDDLYSTFKFLRIPPFSERRWWQSQIINNKNAIVKLQTLMKLITLRRTKGDKINGRPILDIPERKDTIWFVDLEQRERELYDSVNKHYKAVVDDLLAQNGQQIMRSYSLILEMLLRLRQICTHSALCGQSNVVARSLNANKINHDLTLAEANRIFQVLRESGEDFCCVCFCEFSLDINVNDDISTVKPVISQCRHLFCFECFNRSKATRKQCPRCNEIISSGFQVTKVQKQQIDNLTDDYEYESNKEEKSLLLDKTEMSAKVKALIADLKRVKHSPDGGDQIKSVVFSQWTKFLSIIEYHFRQNSISYLRFDGQLNVAQRQQVLQRFRSEDRITVLLMSLKAGGVGLNLTCASRVYLMDPWWNPSVENQAIDRVHRLGQKRVVETIRVVTHDSIEERMLELQKQKMDLAKTALMDREEGRKVQQLRREDLNYLFDIK